MSFVTDFATLWLDIQTDIAATRVGLGLPALNGPDGIGTGTISVGREFVPFQLDAPCIAVVPTGITFEPALRGGERDLTLAGVYVAGRTLFTMELEHEAWIWAEPDPTGADTSYDFSTALEMLREFCGSLIRRCGGIPSVVLRSARFEQPSDVRRRGRMLVLPFSILSPLIDEPYVVLPFATPTSTGVTIAATIVEEFYDGTSSIAGIITAPP